MQDYLLLTSNNNYIYIYLVKASNATARGSRATTSLKPMLPATYTRYYKLDSPSYTL